MTPVPKKKHTRSRSNKRKNAIQNALNVPNLMVCPNCKKFKLLHKACSHCGFYK